jgi:hypothetical protein
MLREKIEKRKKKNQNAEKEKERKINRGMVEEHT